MNDTIAHAVGRFTELLERRLSLSVQTTEDSVRYTFFAALLGAGVPPEQLILEHSDRGRSRQEIDTVLLGSDMQPLAALEFKYHRRTPGGSNQPKPQAAGKLMRDFTRLLEFRDPIGRFVVYVTDEEMAGYLCSPQNGLDRLFGLQPGESLALDDSYFHERGRVFHNEMKSWPCPAVVECVAANSLPKDHVLKVWRVEPAEPPM